MSTEIMMPQLGESVVEGTVEKWLKAVGDPIERFEPLVEISTDKVVTEIPSPAAGVLLAIHVAEGQTVAKGTLLAVIGESEPTPLTEPPVPQPATQDVPQQTATPPTSHQSNGWHVTPVVARMAAEHQLDLTQIHGSGRGGRVTKKDVEAWLAGRHPPSVSTSDEPQPWDTPGSGSLFRPSEEYAQPKPAPAGNMGAEHGLPLPSASPAAPLRLHPVEPVPQAADGELVPLSPMRRAIAERMVVSEHTAPHVTTVFEVDMTRVLAHRDAHQAGFAQQGVNLTLTAYFVAAAAEALRATPALNTEWRDDGMYHHRRIHVGIAVALEEGLIVPVIRDANERNLLGVARAVNDVAARARSKQLQPDEVRGGTFTITNHGVSGSLFATPIIQQPQVGILGVGVMEQRVKVIEGMIAIRPCAYVSLTFDHRAADGATADSFMLVFKRAIESWEA
ncbi:MAG: dihydrolipoamide acetyltransferase family protein [Chloroflexota bacterium]|nr:dihydrolipoamide acetyltransferase family protein [Chloroflexota bacterium]